MVCSVNINQLINIVFLDCRTYIAFSNLSQGSLLAHLESAYSLIWGADRIWEQCGGVPLALL